MPQATTELLERLATGCVLTDSGLETDLIFHGGFDLPSFAVFVLLDDAAGLHALRSYFRDHANIAANAGTPFIFETPTWRANPDWGSQVGYDLARLADANRRAVELVRAVAGDLADELPASYVSGCVGPRGDGYAPAETMTADEARRYHEWQVGVFADVGVDFVTAITLTYVDEAVGFLRAAAGTNTSAVVSLTVETDGRLPDGTPLADAVTQTDDATNGSALYFMVNCAHPDHFEAALDPAAAWTTRIRGVRANASRRSHAELDDADDLDDGNPAELADQYAALRRRLPALAVLGGCCGTDARHVRAIAAACARPTP